MGAGGVPAHHSSSCRGNGQAPGSAATPSRRRARERCHDRAGLTWEPAVPASPPGAGTGARPHGTRAGRGSAWELRQLDEPVPRGRFSLAPPAQVSGSGAHVAQSCLWHVRSNICLMQLPAKCVLIVHIGH